MTSLITELNARFPNGAFFSPTKRGAIAASRTPYAIRLEPPFTDVGDGYVSAMNTEKGTDIRFKVVSLTPDALGVVVDTGPGSTNLYLWPIKKGA